MAPSPPASQKAPSLPFLPIPLATKRPSPALPIALRSIARSAEIRLEQAQIGNEPGIFSLCIRLLRKT
jgi:hypothetical protein